MTEEQKRQWDAYDVLRKAAHDRFYERQKIEYRVLMSFWAAIAAFIVLLLRDEVKDWHKFHQYIVGGLAALSFIAWFPWTAGLRRRQVYDRDICRFFESEMMKIAGLEFSKEVMDETAHFKKRPMFIWVWAHLLQLSITALLLVALVLVAWAK